MTRCSKELKIGADREYTDKCIQLYKRYRKDMNKAGIPLRKFHRTPEYKQFSAERGELPKDVLDRNRRLLFDNIKKSEIPEDKLIIVTHERMYKIAEDGVTPLLHVYGHEHEYKFNEFMGTYYLNAAAVDNGLFERLDPCPEGYCIVEFANGKVAVKRKRIPKRIDKKYRIGRRRGLRGQQRRPGRGDLH